MADKFAWERDNAKQNGKRHRRPEHHARKPVTPAPIQIRNRCRECGSFRVRKHMTTFKCQQCGNENYRPLQVRVRIKGSGFEILK